MANTYTIKVQKQDYSNINLENSENEPISFQNPDFFKQFFHNDRVIFEGIEKSLKLVSRSLPSNIPGVLELFGTYKFKANKRGVPAYLFRPLDKKYPVFTVHSTLKRNSRCNKLVTIKLRDWSDRIPSGEIVRVLGDIDDVDAIQNSLLFKYEVYPNKTNYNLNKVNPVFDFTARTHITQSIYSIDPEGCRDIDDAFSIIPGKILIHISDVYSFLTKNNLISKVNNTTSIYLIDKVMHSIDNKLSTDWCSLIADTKRYMITLEIDIESKDYKFYPSYGLITGNFSYDRYPEEINNSFEDVKQLYKHFTGTDKILEDSHQFIECLMIMYNHLFVKNLLDNNKNPIYRVQEKTERRYENAGNELERFLNIISSKSANYSWEDIGHDHLNMKGNYSHTTSPIRRIVDLLNQEIYFGENILIQKFDLNMINEFNNRLKKFYRKLDLIKLVSIIQEKEFIDVKCHIYDYVNECLQIYIPEYDISVSYRIINDKTRHFSNLELINDVITLTIDDNIFKCTLGEEMFVRIYGKLNIYDLDSSVKIELFN